MLNRRKDVKVRIVVIALLFIFLINSVSYSDGFLSTLSNWKNNIKKGVKNIIYSSSDYITQTILCKWIDKEINEILNGKKIPIPDGLEDEIMVFFREVLRKEPKKIKILSVEKDKYYYNMERVWRPFDLCWIIRVDTDDVYYYLIKDINQNKFYRFGLDKFCDCSSISEKSLYLEYKGFLGVPWRLLCPQEVAFEKIKKVLRYYNLPEDREKIQVRNISGNIYYRFNLSEWEGIPVVRPIFECEVNGITGEIVSVFCVKPFPIKNKIPKETIGFEEGRAIVENWIQSEKKYLNCEDYIVEDISPRLVIAPNVFREAYFKENGYLPMNLRALYESAKLLNRYYRCNISLDRITTNFLERPGYFYAYEMKISCKMRVIGRNNERIEIIDKYIFISPETKQVIGCYYINKYE